MEETCTVEVSAESTSYVRFSRFAKTRAAALSSLPRAAKIEHFESPTTPRFLSRGKSRENDRENDTINQLLPIDVSVR